MDGSNTIYNLVTAILVTYRLVLKRFASIILLRSLDPTLGLCNGTCLTVRSVCKRMIDAGITTGSHVGNRVFIPRIPLLTPTANPQHYLNVMGRSGIFSEQDLHCHIDRIRSPNEWGTNTELI